MIHTVAHIFRKPALSRPEFSAYYETHHTRLARRTLPEFAHYRRNHVLESTDDDRCPDSISEFAYADEDRLQLTRAILGDPRGQELLDDELKFMDKVRNRFYRVAPLPAAVDCDCAGKQVALLRGAAPDAMHWLASLQKIDAALRGRMLYSSDGGAAGDGTGAEQLHWLMGWSADPLPLGEWQDQLRAYGVPVLWSARVAEHKGYPA